ncbi:type II toxin-antitoxin system PemK/MazF family toxin [Paenibacillus agricola]|uniref:mRNA interferase n=1 Tax=Paenibacillus agricola TaxID=2716264 RepID=A0ABX0JAN2_9BACL|nr:type II toxin-antitoxin system PemK/MazF family toxin [Paenibacillus agricola]NHN33515.1 type II toxin-antitoxin system PemK/MazF family toxin [Paenibacillus agricola]
MGDSIQRGDVWVADLGTPNGSEQRGTRPVLIIQNDVGNQHSPTVIVAALTDSGKRYMPTHVPVSARDGLKKDSVVLLEQVRTIDKSLLRDWVCELSEDEMVKVNYAIRVSIGLIPAPAPTGGRAK